MTEVEKLTKQIYKYSMKINELKQKRKDVCTHENIKEEHFCDDDYAQFAYRTYTTSYTCQDCGLYASNDTGLYPSKEKSPEFILLELKNRQNKYGKKF